MTYTKSKLQTTTAYKIHCHYIFKYRYIVFTSELVYPLSLLKPKTTTTLILARILMSDNP